MLKLRIKYDAHCQKHPRYNPAIEGESGIKGGCTYCTALLDVWNCATAFRKTADAFLHTPQVEEVPPSSQS
jgi:hypothetical protein